MNFLPYIWKSLITSKLSWQPYAQYVYVTFTDSPRSKLMSIKMAADISNPLHDMKWRNTRSRWKRELTQTAIQFRHPRHILTFRIIEETKIKCYQKILLRIFASSLQRGICREVNGYHILRIKETHQIKISLSSQIDLFREAKNMLGLSY